MKFHENTWVKKHKEQKQTLEIHTPGKINGNKIPGQNFPEQKSEKQNLNKNTKTTTNKSVEHTLETKHIKTARIKHWGD